MRLKLRYVIKNIRILFILSQSFRIIINFYKTFIDPNLKKEMSQSKNLAAMDLLFCSLKN